MSLNHIELFAGCGGLSLGLESIGFELLLANELSPMAAESFAFNLLNEDLLEKSKKGQKPSSTVWLNSNFSELSARLRENPFQFPQYNAFGYSDMPSDPRKLIGKLVVGSIIELNSYIKSNSYLLNNLKNAFGKSGGLDLVSGGPPCQSFSMAGKRERDNDKNSLPWEFARFVEMVQPKIVLLENVTGILRAFKDESGKSFHAWYEVAKVFASIGYLPLCLHVNARMVGVAQNRPRFIMIGIRHDHYIKISSRLTTTEGEIFSESEKFFSLVKKHGADLPFGHLGYWDSNKKEHLSIFEKTFLKKLICNKEVSVKDALDDLKTCNPTEPSTFVRNLNATFSFLKKKDTLKNHELRKNSDIVRRRFRIYQILQLLNDKSVAKSVFDILKGNSTFLSDDSWEKLSRFDFLQHNNELQSFSEKSELEKYLLEHPTRKQTQKALTPETPAPAALSIPDDACHYDEHELRVLTVREMARIQSFPDSFEFRSKVTTGGQMRKFEVPQYTQVGNAVPPLLGKALGETIKYLM